MSDLGAAAEFPSVLDLVERGSSSPGEQETIQDWLSLSAELQAMVPHVSELIVSVIGGPQGWAEMNEAKRNIMTYGAVSLLAEAKRRATPIA